MTLQKQHFWSGEGPLAAGEGGKGHVQDFRFQTRRQILSPMWRGQMLGEQRLKIILYRIGTLKFQSGREVKEFRIQRCCPDSLWMPSPLPQPPTLPPPSCPLALPHKLSLSCKLYELQGKEYLQLFSANNLPSRPTHLDSVKLERILAGKVLFPQDRGRARHTLSGGTPASRRKGLMKGSGGAFPVFSSKLTQIHSFLGKSKWKLGESRCHTMEELPSLGRKQQVLGRNVPPFVIRSATFFSFEHIAWNYAKDDVPFVPWLCLSKFFHVWKQSSNPLQ